MGRIFQANGYMYMYSWVTSLFICNYQNIVNRLYPHTKLKIKNKKKEKKKMLVTDCGANPEIKQILSKWKRKLNRNPNKVHLYNLELKVSLGTFRKQINQLFLCVCPLPPGLTVVQHQLPLLHRNIPDSFSFSKPRTIKYLNSYWLIISSVAPYTWHYSGY